ncbi:MAG TPA: FHA domain-containing protein [Polyangiaceae bacterium]|nr:FHA domain-containing protein [Polyangiaceae bacterium]
MAELRRTDGTRSCLLMTEHLVGRGPQCALRLSGGYVSAQHALIRWDGRAWEILDRGSRNGTQLNGALLEPGRGYRLVIDSVVTFGHLDERWVLVDAGEPQAMAVSLETGQALLGAQGLIGLPSSKQPECTLFLAPDAVWKIERANGEVEALSDGQVIECAGQSFRFCCPSPNSAMETLSLAQDQTVPTLHFMVSSDEDFVELSLEYAERSVPLGSRSHNYLMLTLARQMLADRAANLPEASCGWMDKDELADGFKMTPQQVDGEVFRIRRHFTLHGLSESTVIIERRPRTKQIRLGLTQLRIERR